MSQVLTTFRCSPILAFFSSPRLISALQCVLTNKDDRCVTDGLRLADLLVVLLSEGRSALPFTMAVSPLILPPKLQIPLGSEIFSNIISKMLLNTVVFQLY